MCGLAISVAYVISTALNARFIGAVSMGAKVWILCVAQAVGFALLAFAFLCLLPGPRPAAPGGVAASSAASASAIALFALDADSEQLN